MLFSRSLAELEDENGALLRENAELMDISNAVRAELNRTRPSETPVPSPPLQAADGINVVLDAQPSTKEERFLRASSVENGGSVRGMSCIRWPGRESSALDERQKTQRPAIDAVRISMSDRETPSQRDRRQCLQQQQYRKRGLLALKNVRNYNIKDDKTYRQQLLKESS